MNLQVNKFIKAVNDEQLAQEGLKVCEHIRVGVSAYVHNLDGSKVLFCEDCHEKQLELNAAGQCTCNDCGKVINIADAHQWTWFDYDVAKGHKPLMLCIECIVKPNHKERVKFDRFAEEKLAASSINQSTVNVPATHAVAFSRKSAVAELAYIYQVLFNNSEPYDKKGDFWPVLNARLSSAISALIDDYVNQQLIWVDSSAVQLAKSVSSHPLFNAEIEKLFGMSISELPESCSVLLAGICDKIHRTIYNIIQGPTWNIWYVTKNGSTVILEKSADFRVIEWYKTKGLVYGASPKDLY